MPDAGGRLAENVMHFARVLRRAGMPVGTDRVATALAALGCAGLESRADFQAALAACFVDRPEHAALFEQAFHVFWRDPDLLGRVMALLLPRVESQALVPPAPQNRRLAEALYPEQGRRAPEEPEQLDFDAELTWSDREVLRRADFETMTSAEWNEAKRLVERLDVWFEPRPTRRTRAALSGRVLDWRATLSRAGRGAPGALSWRRARRRAPPIVVLADISGSMSRYSRMLLHFAHALGRSNVRVASFVFGTRLTAISRYMRERDPDRAVGRAVDGVADWSGGTRISQCLHEFNQHWSRRVLAQDATVLLISDGLEQGDTKSLSFEMERLSKSCRCLVWLNPLLRYDRFEPRAAGIRAMLPWVDRFLPAHNVDSLGELVRVLAASRAPARQPFPGVRHADVR